MAKRSGEYFFVITLFLLFAVAGLFVVAMGASAYEETANTMTKNYDMRTSLLYISEKVRQNDNLLEIREGPQGDALVFFDDSHGVSFETWIFCADGALREVSVPIGTKVKAYDGQEIMEMQHISFSLEGELLTTVVTLKDGESFAAKVLTEEGKG